jgi:hypothetical protein
MNYLFEERRDAQTNSRYDMFKSYDLPIYMHFVSSSIQSHHQIPNPRLSLRIARTRCLAILTVKQNQTFSIRGFGESSLFKPMLRGCQISYMRSARDAPQCRAWRCDDFRLTTATSDVIRRRRRRGEDMREAPWNVGHPLDRSLRRIPPLFARL